MQPTARIPKDENIQLMGADLPLSFLPELYVLHPLFYKYSLDQAIFILAISTININVCEDFIS
jgi:hypothetical protein